MKINDFLKNLCFKILALVAQTNRIHPKNVSYRLKRECTIDDFISTPEQTILM